MAIGGPQAGVGTVRICTRTEGKNNCALPNLPKKKKINKVKLDASYYAHQVVVPYM
jgi:hypothetical protein